MNDLMRIKVDRNPRLLLLFLFVSYVNHQTMPFISLPFCTCFLLLFGMGTASEYTIFGSFLQGVILNSHF